MRAFITSENAAFLTLLTQVQCGWIARVAWAPDGITLAVAGGEDVHLYVGSFGGTPTHKASGHTGPVKSVAFSPARVVDGKLRLMMASSSADTTIRIWEASDLDNGVELIGELGGYSDTVEAVAFSPTYSPDPREHMTLAACSADGSIRIHDLETGETRATLTGHEAEVTGVAFALDGNLLISGSRDTTVRVWDVHSETGGTIIGRHEDWVRDVAANPGGTLLATASKDGTVKLWDPHTGEQFASIRANSGGVECVAFSPDGRLLATGGRDNIVRLWNVHYALDRGVIGVDQALATLQGHEKPIMSAAFNPAGTLLATGSGDNTVKLWSVDEDLAQIASQQSSGPEMSSKTTRLRDLD